MKPWYKSKTLWVALLTYAGLIINEMAVSAGTGKELKDFAIWVLPFIMITLRFVTNSGIGSDPEDPVEDGVGVADPGDDLEDE